MGVNVANPGSLLHRLANFTFHVHYNESARKIGFSISSCAIRMLNNDAKHVLLIRRWVEKIVVDLNLCPFAEGILAQDSWRVRVIEGDVSACLTELASECQYLESALKIDTSLLILPQGYDQFSVYLDLLGMAERLLAELNYSGEFQLASFHPDYCFSGSEQEAVENYTNRAPLPVLQILRESSISTRLRNYAEPEAIPLRNKATLQKLGLNEIKKRLHEIR